jgi:hypothetical protein
MEFHDTSSSCSPCQAQARRVPLQAKPKRSPRRKSGYRSQWVETLMAHSEGQRFSYKGKMYKKGKGVRATPMKRSPRKK